MPYPNPDHFGLLTRPIAAMLAVEMAVVTFGWHLGNGYFCSSPGGGYGYPLLLMGIYTAVVLRGGGRYLLDRLVGKEL